MLASNRETFKILTNIFAQPIFDFAVSTSTNDTIVQLDRAMSTNSVE